MSPLLMPNLTVITIVVKKEIFIGAIKIIYMHELANKDL
jgi:hypothetical protein